MNTLAILFVALGAVHIDSTPRGATVTPLVDDAKPIGRTPKLVREPGTYIVELEGYEPQTVTVDDSKTIERKKLVLVKQRYRVNVIFEEPDWAICINGKPMVGDKGLLIAPATVRVASGTVIVSLVKEGYRDIHKRLDVKPKHDQEITIKTKPQHGTSRLLPLLQHYRFVGVWESVATGSTFTLQADGGILVTKPSGESHTNCSWTMVDLTSIRIRGKDERVGKLFKLDDKGQLVGEWLMRRR